MVLCLYSQYRKLPSQWDNSTCVPSLPLVPLCSRSDCVLGPFLEPILEPKFSVAMYDNLAVIPIVSDWQTYPVFPNLIRSISKLENLVLEVFCLVLRLNKRSYLYVLLLWNRGEIRTQILENRTIMITILLIIMALSLINSLTRT